MQGDGRFSGIPCSLWRERQDVQQKSCYPLYPHLSDSCHLAVCNDLGFELPGIAWACDFHSEVSVNRV